MDSLRPRNLTDVFRSLRRQKLAIIVPALVVAVASAIAIKRMPNTYESSTFIIVESGQSKDYSEMDLDRRLASIQQQVTSRSGLESIITENDLFKAEVEKGSPVENLVDRMRANISVNVNQSREDSTDAFTISYRAHDPETARLVTSELANHLIGENMKAIESQVSGEADVLRQRAAELSGELRQLEEKTPWLMTLKEDAPMAPAPGTGVRSAGPSLDAVRAQQMSIENLKDQQYKLQQQISDVDRRIAEQRQVVEQQKTTAPIRDNPTLGALIAKRAELQGQRDNLINQQELTDKHPRVIAVNDQIAAVNRAISEARQQGGDSVSQTPEMRELRALESERNRLKTELEVANRAAERQIANPPRVASVGPVGPPPSPASRDVGAARLAQDYLGLKQTYKETLSKLQNAELKRQTIGSQKVEQFRVLDQAYLPQVPVWPDRKLLFAISIGVGLLIGALFAFIIEFRRFTSIQDVKDVEHYTRLPLLAAIPKTVTPVERSRAERQARTRLAFGMAAAVVATFALTEILIITDLFALFVKK